MLQTCMEQHLELCNICEELLGRRPVHALQGRAWRSRPTFSEAEDSLTPIFCPIAIH